MCLGRPKVDQNQPLAPGLKFDSMEGEKALLLLRTVAMSKSTESTVELVKKALERKFGDRRSYFNFENGHLRLDLKGYLTSERGRKALDEHVKAAQSVPTSPGRRHKMGG